MVKLNVLRSFTNMSTGAVYIRGDVIEVTSTEAAMLFGDFADAFDPADQAAFDIQFALAEPEADEGDD